MTRTGGPAALTRVALTRVVLLVEEAWNRAMPLFGIAGLFLLLALLGAFGTLSFALHAGILALFAAALPFAAWRGFRTLRFPGRAAAERRLERDSGLDHRPLATLSDRLAGNTADPLTRALWDAHRARMAAHARAVRPAWPRLGLAARDPCALRWALALLLVAAAAATGGSWRARLGEALDPTRHLPPPVPPVLDLWLNPPDYTGLPPVFLSKEREQGKEEVAAPAGSTLLARLHGGKGVPRLDLDGKGTDFTPVDRENYRLSLLLPDASATPESAVAVLQDGTVIGRWPIRVIPDTPPRIAFAAPPAATERGSLRIDYNAADDYGVTEAKALLRRAGDNPEDTVELPLPPPVQDRKAGHGTGFYDLSAHRWAGLPVEIRLAAKDAIGQTGESAAQTIVLPERRFHHPVARALAAMRKRLLADPGNQAAIVPALDELTERPDTFRDDATVFLALRVAAERLAGGQAAAEDREAVEDILWQSALRVEEGRDPAAGQDLHALQRKLQERLAANAPDSEIDRLMNELRQAMDRYLESMAEGLAQQRELPEAPPGETVSPQDLQRLLDRARDLARTGARDAARALLSELQNLLENLEAVRAMGQGEGKRWRDTMRQMRDMMQEQQQLMERSFRGERDIAGRQETLRRKLAGMMGRMDGTAMPSSPALEQAGQAMREAVAALRRGAAKDAVQPQAEALGRLQEAARALEAEMARQQGGAKSPGGTPMRDPLGRMRTGTGGLLPGEVRIPEAGEIQKSRVILDELRRRSGERLRPEDERDYIDRLLKQF